MSEQSDAWEEFLQQYEWKALLRHHPELGEHSHAYHSDDNRCVVCGALGPEVSDRSGTP